MSGPEVERAAWKMILTHVEDPVEAAARMRAEIDVGVAAEGFGTRDDLVDAAIFVARVAAQYMRLAFELGNERYDLSLDPVEEVRGQIAATFLAAGDSSDPRGVA